MLAVILSMVLTNLPGGELPRINLRANRDAKAILEAAESHLRPVQDLRCEFEGAIQFQNRTPEKRSLGGTGRPKAFRGVYYSAHGGDVFIDSFHQCEEDRFVTRVIWIVRPRDRQWEHYVRQTDEPLGFSVSHSTEEFLPWPAESPLSLFLIEKLKRELSGEHYDATIHEDRLEDRPMKVVDLAYKLKPDLLQLRYWIDPQRGGHVVRRESFQGGVFVRNRTEVTLAKVSVSGNEVWLPVNGVQKDYGSLSDLDLVDADWSSLTSVKIVDGSLAINQHPGPDTFTFKFSPEFPVSDELARMRADLARQTATRAFSETSNSNEPSNRRLAYLSRPPHISRHTGNRAVVPEQPPWLVGSLGLILLFSPIVAWKQWRIR